MEAKGKTILLVLCGSPSRRTVLESIHATQVRIVCVNPTVAWASDLVYEWIVAPCDDRSASLAIVREYVKRTYMTFDGIMCYDEFGLALAAILAKNLGLSFLSPDTVEKTRDKYIFRKICAEHGLPSPRCTHLNPDIVCHSELCPLGKHLSPLPSTSENKPITPSSTSSSFSLPPPLSTALSPNTVHPLAAFDFFAQLEDVAKQIEEQMHAMGLAFPIVIKPTHGAGKMCTRKASNALEAAEAVCMLHARMSGYIERWRMTYDEARSMVLEEYLEGGPEVDVDCLVQRVSEALDFLSIYLFKNPLLYMRMSMCIRCVLCSALIVPHFIPPPPKHTCIHASTSSIIHPFSLFYIYIYIYSSKHF